MKSYSDKCISSKSHIDWKSTAPPGGKGSGQVTKYAEGGKVVAPDLWRGKMIDKWAKQIDEASQPGSRSDINRRQSELLNKALKRPEK